MRVVNPTGSVWVLYDGECRFCCWCAAWAKRKDRQKRLRVTPFQSAPSPPMTAELKRLCERAVHVITEDGDIIRGGRATVYVLSSIPHLGWLRVLSIPPLLWLAELAYWLAARNRSLLGRLLSLRDDNDR